MRPLAIALHAFGPYPYRVQVDFERLAEHGLFLIHGRTGAGKSTLLDAMTYALFGDGKEGPERSGREFVSAHAPLERSHAELTFAVAGGRYRVVRYPAQQVARSRARAGASDPVERPAEARLERIAPDGSVHEVMAEKSTEVTRTVEGLLGCSVAQFRQTVVLPQGEFRQVVTDEKARRAVLERIFDTQRFKRLTQALKTIAAEIEREGAEQRRRRDRVLSDAGVERPEALHQAREQAAGAERDARGAREARDRERQQQADRLRTGQGQAERFERLAQLEAKVQALDEGRQRVENDTERLKDARRAQGLQSAFDQRARASGEVHEAQTALDQATAKHERLVNEHAEAAEAAGRERGREPERAGAREQLTQLERLEPDVEALASQRKERDLLAEALAPKREQRSGLAQQRDALLQERTALIAERSPLRPAADAYDAARERGDEARSRREAWQEVLGIEAAIAREQRSLDEAEAAAADELGAVAGTPLLELLRSQAAGLVSEALEQGEPCPACGSVHHPAPHPPADLERLRGSLEAYQRLRAARARSEGQVAVQRAHAEALIERHGWSAARPDGGELERAVAEASERLDEAQQARTRLREIDGRLEAIEPELERRTQQLQDLERAIGSDEAEHAALERDIQRTLAKLPTDAQDPERFSERLGGARQAVRALEDALEAANEVERRARAALETGAALAKERRAAVERAQERRSTAEQAFAHGLAQAGFADEPSFMAARLSDRATEALDASIRAYVKERTGAEAQRDELRTALAGAEQPDLEALRAALHDAEQRWQAADEAYQQAWQEHRRLERLVADLAAADAAYANLEARLAAATNLAQVASGTVKGRPKVDLETFVLQRQFQDVLQVGNTHLRTMTAGRYTLHLVRDTGRASDTGLDLEVADHHVDSLRRPARTLSGGEGFLAALALALGLSDVAQRAKHPIEALFIDEGFGSLDRATLDDVTHTLRSLPRAAGRVVGIISHVEELRRLIPVQLVITAGAHGSDVELRINA